MIQGFLAKGEWIGLPEILQQAIIHNDLKIILKPSLIILFFPLKMTNLNKLVTELFSTL